MGRSLQVVIGLIHKYVSFSNNNMCYYISYVVIPVIPATLAAKSLRLSSVFDLLQRLAAHVILLETNELVVQYE